jgi:EpsI family protein
MSGTYLCSGQPVSAFVATYIGNTQGRELVNDNNKVVPDALQWRAATRTYGFASGDGQVIQVNELQVDQSGASSLIWYWYQTGDTAATNPVAIKATQAFDLLRMRRMNSTAYVLHTPVDEVVDASRKRLTRVARQLVVSETVAAAQTIPLVER